MWVSVCFAIGGHEAQRGRGRAPFFSTKTAFLFEGSVPCGTVRVMPRKLVRTPLLYSATKQILNVVPDKVGFPLLRTLSARVRRSPLTELERQAMAFAVPFKVDGKPAYRWGRGPLVVLVHGWAGRAAQMGPLALSLAQSGFQAVAFDVTGHGESSRKSTSWSAFLDDISGVAGAVGQPLFACVGHSAGGLSAMALRQRESFARHYITICSPSHPFPAVEFIERLVSPSQGVMKAYRDDLATQFGTSWQSLEKGSSYAGAGAESLLIYDTGDRVVPDSEGDKLRELFPEIALRKLGPSGHTKILSTPELGQAVIEFLKEQPATVSADFGDI